jgi:hypothetical protein
MPASAPRLARLQRVAQAQLLVLGLDREADLQSSTVVRVEDDAEVALLAA